MRQRNDAITIYSKFSDRFPSSGVHKLPRPTKRGGFKWICIIHGPRTKGAALCKTRDEARDIKRELA